MSASRVQSVAHDWDSPSSHTGTVKRRPNSLDASPVSSSSSSASATPPPVNQQLPAIRPTSLYSNGDTKCTSDRRKSKLKFPTNFLTNERPQSISDAVSCSGGGGSVSVGSKGLTSLLADTKRSNGVVVSNKKWSATETSKLFFGTASRATVNQRKTIRPPSTVAAPRREPKSTSSSTATPPPLPKSGRKSYAIRGGNRPVTDFRSEKFTELYRDFPASETPLIGLPPQYREPLPPVPVFVPVPATDWKNPKEVTADDDNDNILSPAATGKWSNHKPNEPTKDTHEHSRNPMAVRHGIENTISPTLDIISRPKFSSTIFKDIPVRPRKGVPHMENYCLFDPSVDFINEKELKRKAVLDNLQPMQTIIDEDDDELIDEIIYDEHDPGPDLDAMANYFLVDPLLMARAEAAGEYEMPVIHEEADPLNQSMTSSSGAQATSSSSSGSSALLSMQNSVIETESSPNRESTDERDSSEYGQVGRSHLTKYQFATCGQSISGSLGDVRGDTMAATVKSSQSAEKLHCQSSLGYSVASTEEYDDAPPKCRVGKRQPNRSNFFSPLRHPRLTPLKLSISSPALQPGRGKVKVPPLESNYVLFNPAPVPSRIQYKVRQQQRPLSTHSDADSGFLSPITPPDGPQTQLSFNPALLVLDQCDSIQGYIEIYTDWANYYLERVKSKKKVVDLSIDCRDGLLLAEVIEAVTTFKVPDLVKKAKTQQQMYDNVNACLSTLRTQSVGGIEAITANDICSGRLKAVLALFFALSRYKQAMRQLPVPHSKVGANGAVTAIPLPATVLVTRRCPPDKVRPLPPTPGQQQQQHHQVIPGLTKQHPNGGLADGNGSPPPIGGIPTQIPKGGSSLRQQQSPCKIPASPYTTQNPITFIPNGVPVQLQQQQQQQQQLQLQQQQQQQQQNVTTTATTKHSMLDKLKLFNKEKSERSKTQISKRTSSSSGFSSARSERSDSSLSLNDGHVTIQPKSNSMMGSLKKTSTAATAVPVTTVDQMSAKQSKSSSKLVPSSKMSNTKDGKLFGGKQTDKKNGPTEKDTAIGNAMVVGGGPIGGGVKLSKTQTQSKLKPASVNRKLEARSESRTSLSQLQASASGKGGNCGGVGVGGGGNIPPPAAVNTGIPKPMAAIKGTSKPAHFRSDESIETGKQLVGKQQTSSDLPTAMRLPGSDNNNVHNSNVCGGNSSSSGGGGGGGGVGGLLTANNNNTTVVDKSTFFEANSNALTNVGGTLSQLQHHTHSLNHTMTDSTHSNSTAGPQSNSSESSVIYRPTSEPGCDMMNHSRSSTALSIGGHPANSGRKLDNYTASMLSMDAARYHHHIMSPPQKYPAVEDDKQMTIMPMRPLMRGYSSHVTLPTRGTRSGQHYLHDYGGEDIGQGYCSDGDALRKVQTRFSADIDNGYMSEGGMPTKHFMSIFRGRPQLPTTIEERCRSSRGENMDRVGMDTNGGVGGIGGGNGCGGGGGKSSRRDHWGGHNMSENQNGISQTPPSPTSVRKEKGSPSHSRRSTSSSKGSSSGSSSSGGRSKGMPQNFGYVKRSNGTSQSPPMQQIDIQNAQLMLNTPGGGRTAHVSAVPRHGKQKVSGGTQTCSTDLQAKLPPGHQHRSLSLTGPGAAQLSQSIRERLSTGSHSLPKPGSELHVFQHRLINRGSGRMTDGSLSDTQTYAEVKPDYGTYAMWLKHSNTAASRLSEGDSLESLAIGSPGMQPRTANKLMRESPYSQSPRLNRSNSIRSTKSEKMYPSMLSRGPDVEIEPYYCLPVGTVPSGGVGAPVPWSQPTSPTPPTRGFGGPLSPTHAGGHRLTYPKKNDDVHGSAASLLSGGSSLYGSTEERQATEVRRLKRELTDARNQVMSLSSQLSTNAHVVAAFEQSLANMTQRLQQLTATAERKDGELTEMRQTIELLRKQSIQAGLTTAHMQSMGVPPNGQPGSGLSLAGGGPASAMTNASGTASTALLNGGGGGNSGGAVNGSGGTPNGSVMQRHHSSDSMCSLNSLSSGCSAQDKKKKKGWLRSSFTKAFSRNSKISKANHRHISSASVNHESPLHNHHSAAAFVDAALPPLSPTKSPQKMVTIIDDAKPVDAIENNPVVDDLKKQLREKDLVLTDIRLEALSSASQLENLKDTVMKMRAEMINLKHNNERLQKIVTSRSLAGSEASLGAVPVSPNGSLGEPRRYSLADSVSRPVSTHTNYDQHAWPQSPTHHHHLQPLDLPKSVDEADEDNIPPAPAPEPPPSPLRSPTTHIDLTPPPQHDSVPSESLNIPAEDVADPTDGKKIAITVYLGQPDAFAKYADEMNESDGYYSSPPVDEDDEEDNPENGIDNGQEFAVNTSLNEFVVAFTYISGKTTWQNLDYIVRKTFKDYLARIDPGTNLGLNTDSITSYHLGEAKRGPEMGFPELLPCGYIIGNVRSLYICLQGVGSLAFDSLIPRSIVHRYISLLTEHRRLILCGPSGTGKSYLARKLAEFLVARSGRGNLGEAIATFNVDHKSSKELRQYLGHIAEQASLSNGVSELPSVIILDNLHHASALGDVFSCLLTAGPAAKLPCIIGTMSQATCNTTNLQLHHNFRWVLTANHMEPVKGFLGRYLRRQHYTLELTTHTVQPQLTAVLAWLPTVWQHINRFLETHSSSDVTIGPRLFLACPLDLADSQVWFTDVWNYHLAPYLVEAVREGVQLYGRRGGAWVDPATFIKDSYPWSSGLAGMPALRQIQAEDVGLEAGVAGSEETQDPLLNMLMRLQEAANYSGSQEQESDCASLDSNITQDSSAGAE